MARLVFEVLSLADRSVDERLRQVERGASFDISEFGRRPVRATLYLSAAHAGLLFAFHIPGVKPSGLAVAR